MAGDLKHEIEGPGPARGHTAKVTACGCVLTALAAAILLATPAAGQVAPADDATYHLGVGTQLARIVSPFTWRCDTERVEMATVAGIEAHTAVVIRRLDFTARVATSRDLGHDCPLVLRVREDGVHIVDHHRGEIDDGWLHALELGVGLTPEGAPWLHGGVGGGWIRDTDAPYLIATLGLRLGDRIRFTTDAGLHYASAPFVRWREEWHGFELADRTYVGQGRSWTPGWLLRAGVEARLR
jgi:hypothetical protein